MATTTPQPPPTSSSTGATQAKPPVTIHPTSHLDPGAYVRGTHAISIDAHVLIHPRAQLISIHGPLIVGSGAIVYEKAVLGGPVPLSTLNPKDRTPATPSTLGTATDADTSPPKTVIGPNTTIHPHAHVLSGATIQEASTLESHATIKSGITVGAHAKICAGCVVDRDVGEWEVVFGDGRQRRKRAGDPGKDEVEKARLKAMQVDRETTVVTLKNAAKAGLVRKK
jgi:carbonic anhydrase/acetyltransferase-like protein (isoleucine patch superfamily)